MWKPEFEALNPPATVAVTPLIAVSKSMISTQTASSTLDSQSGLTDQSPYLTPFWPSATPTSPFSAWYL